MSKDLQSFFQVQDLESLVLETLFSASSNATRLRNLALVSAPFVILSVAEGAIKGVRVSLDTHNCLWPLGYARGDKQLLTLAHHL